MYPCDQPCIEVLFSEFGVDKFDPLLGDQRTGGLEQHIKCRMIRANWQLTLIQPTQKATLVCCVLYPADKRFEGRVGFEKALSKCPTSLWSGSKYLTETSVASAEAQCVDHCLRTRPVDPDHVGVGLMHITFKNDLGVFAAVDWVKETSQTPQLQTLQVSTK